MACPGILRLLCISAEASAPPLAAREAPGCEHLSSRLLQPKLPAPPSPDPCRVASVIHTLPGSPPLPSCLPGCASHLPPAPRQPMSHQGCTRSHPFSLLAITLCPPLHHAPTPLSPSSPAQAALCLARARAPSSSAASKHHQPPSPTSPAPSCLSKTKLPGPGWRLVQPPLAPTHRGARARAHVHVGRTPAWHSCHPPQDGAGFKCGRMVIGPRLTHAPF